MWIDENKTYQSFVIDRTPNADKIPEAELEILKTCPKIDENDVRAINRCFGRYIFYNRKKYKTVCFCSYCNSEFTADPDTRIAHNEEYDCPKCGQTGVAKSAGYAMKNLSQYHLFTVYKECSETLFALNFKVHKIYNGDKYSTFNNSLYSNKKFQRMPDLEASLHSVYVWRKGEAIKYMNNWQFRKTCSAFAFPFITGTYTNSVKVFEIGAENIEKTFLKYAYRANEKSEVPYNSCQFLSLCTVYPIAELVLKTGLTQYINNLIYSGIKNAYTVNWNAKSPAEFFKYLNFNEAKYVSEHQISPPVVKTYSKFKRNGTPKDWEFCRAYNDYCGNGWKRYCFNDIKSVDIKNFQDFEKLYSYCKRQTENTKRTAHENIQFYADYIKNLEELGTKKLTQGQKFPRNLQEAHDNAVANVNYMREQKELEKKAKERKTAMEGYEKLYKKLCRFYGKFQPPGGLTLIVPKDFNEILHEGAALEHCVGGYAARHCKGQTTILFIRRTDEPDKPYFTAEVKGSKDFKDLCMVQCHGFKNEWVNEKHIDKPQEIQAFEQSFTAFLNNPNKYIKEHLHNG